MYDLQSYEASANSFMCPLIPESSSSHVEYTPGGLIYKPSGSNLQRVTSITFLLLVYANYLARISQNLNCGNITVSRSCLRQQGKKQVDYLLGDIPMSLSTVVRGRPRWPLPAEHTPAWLVATVHQGPVRIFIFV